MSARHPNRQRLQRWLDTGEPRRVAKHVERCLHCQEALEIISALDERLVADLQAATAPPEDLRERTHGGVDLRLRNEAALGVFLDIFTIGWDVARCIVDPITLGESPHDDGPPADQIDEGAS